MAVEAKDGSNSQTLTRREAGLLLLTTPLLAALGCNNNKPLPNLPPGYSWQKSQLTRAAIPVPDGWYFVEDQLKDIRKESTFSRVSKLSNPKDPDNSLLLVKAFRKTEQIEHIKPSKLASMYIKNITGRDAGSSTTNEPFISYSVVSDLPINTLAGNYITRQLTKAVGNDDTGSFYVETFLSPASEWKSNNDLRNTLIGNLHLDPNF